MGKSELEAAKKMNMVWQNFKTNFGSTSTELDKPILEKYLGDLFCVGDFYYYVVDFSTFPDLKLSYIDPTALAFHGMTKEEFSFDAVLSTIHPDDVLFCTACEKVIFNLIKTLEYGELLHYKTSYTVKIKDGTGNYRFIQHQGIPVGIDANGGMTHAINVHTDIGHIKQESGGTMSILGLNGRPSYIGIDPFNPVFTEKNPFSDREREILDLLARGLTSKAIGKILSISSHTVDTHRRTMLKKLEASNTMELVQKAKTSLFF